MSAAIVFLGGALAGGAWRRWEGMAMTGFFAHRWLKLTVVALFGFALALYASRDLFAAAAVAAIVTVGWTPPAQFGAEDDERVPWGLALRYGVVTVLAALAAALVLRDWHPLLYAPIGALAPFGYALGKTARRVAGFTCWSCVGECWLGFTIYGGLFLLRGAT